MLVFLRCVCVCVYVCGCGCVGVFVGLCVCGCGMLICFVSALGSHEMGRHKLPIIIIIIVSWLPACVDLPLLLISQASVIPLLCCIDAVLSVSSSCVMVTSLC